MDDRILQLTSAIATRAVDPDAGVADARWLVDAQDQSIAELLEILGVELIDHSQCNESLLTSTLRRLLERAHPERGRARRMNDAMRGAAVKLYGILGPNCRPRHMLLRLLTVSRQPDDLRAVAELLATDPPRDANEVAIALGPLFQHDDYQAESLFPRLLDACHQPSAIMVALDLSNYVAREELLPAHPAQSRCDALTKLLGEIVQRLGAIEERPETGGQDEQELSRVVSESVSLAVSLCDALALIGNPSSIGKLNQALGLRHRRLRTEAAAALARLGDTNGQEVLVSLAAEPVARLRVLAYADELGLSERIAAEFSTPVARAESELALWLAQPTQLGFPPSRLELIDSRVMYWPGYDEPVECFLFRFGYEFGTSEYTNIGISGPLCHAFAADLADLPPDDIYAVFAGWQAEHDEITETDIREISDGRAMDVARLERRLRDDGYDAIQPLSLGSFFGETALIAQAMRDSLPGIAVATLDGIQWLPTLGRRRPLGPTEAYCLFKGRRLLQTFNP